MPSGAVIGALRVVLGADTAALDKGLKDAQSSLSSFAISAKIGLAAVAVGIAGAAAGIGAAVKSAINTADELGKTSQKLGISVEELSKLQFAAELSDVSLETLSKTLVKFDKNLSAIAGGAVNDLSRTLDVMRVSVQNSDGSLKDQLTLLGDIAEKFQSYEDSAAKTALAVELFGKSGANLIPLLNQGRTGLKELTDEADRLGLTISGQTAKSAEAFNDNMKRLNATHTAFVRQLTAELAPGLERASEILLEFSRDTQTTEPIVKAIGDAFTKVIQEIQVFILSVRRIGAEWNAFREFLKAPLFSDEFYAKWKAVNDAGTLTDRMITDLRASFNNVIVPIGTTGDAMGAAAENAGKLQAPVLQAKDSIDQFELALDRAAKQIIEQSMPAWQQIEMQIGKNKLLFDTGRLSVEQYQQANEFAARSAKDSWDNSLSSIAGSASSLTKTLGKENKAMGIASKAFAISQVIINTQIAVTKALAQLGPNPIGYLAAAAAVASGAAAIASIGAQGFAQGGSFRVPGGMSSTDNQLVPLNLAAGERVDITPNQSGPGTTLQIDMRSGDPYYSRGNVERLLDAMHTVLADGHQARLVVLK